ncbi:MAG: Abortive infection protein [Acidobacteriales bacterium]|nr:Abortive infection protein [Terriglobales bacterium]
MTPESPLQELPLEPQPNAEPGWGILDILAILLIGYCALVVSAKAGFAMAHSLPRFAGLSIDKVASSPLFVVPVQLIAYLIAFVFARMLITVRAQQDFWEAVKWKFPSVSAVGTYVLVGFVMAIVAQIAGHFLPIPKSLPFDRYFQEPVFIYLMMAFGVLVAPLVEELLFRGLLYPVAVRWLGGLSGTVLTALLFALVHQSQLAHSWAPLLVIFGVGLVLTSVRARADSLAASWIVHVSYNATLFAVLFYATSGFRHLERLAE